MKVLAYILAFLLAPTVGALSSLILFPVLALVRRRGAFAWLTARAFIFLAGGLAAVWFAGQLFSWLGQTPTIFMAVILGAGYALNHFRRVRASFGSPVYWDEWVSMVGSISGVILGALLFVSPKASSVLVVPGKSIAGVEIGMSKAQVIEKLGKPSRFVSADEIKQLGHFRSLGGGPLTEELPKLSLMIYSFPPLFVGISDADRVVALQLGYTDKVRIEGYDFLGFKYLSRDEIDSIGKPTSTVRDPESEKLLLAGAPKRTSIEYYVFHYDGGSLVLGLIFDRTKEKSSKHFIALNYVAVLQVREGP